MLHYTKCMHPSLWQQFKKEPNMGVVTRCPHNIGCIVYTKTTAINKYIL